MHLQISGVDRQSNIGGQFIPLNRKSSTQHRPRRNGDRLFHRKSRKQRAVKCRILRLQRELGPGTQRMRRRRNRSTSIQREPEGMRHVQFRLRLHISERSPHTSRTEYLSGEQHPPQCSVLQRHGIHHIPQPDRHIKLRPQRSLRLTGEYPSIGLRIEPQRRVTRLQIQRSQPHLPTVHPDRSVQANDLQTAPFLRGQRYQIDPQILTPIKYRIGRQVHTGQYNMVRIKGFRYGSRSGSRIVFDRIVGQRQPSERNGPHRRRIGSRLFARLARSGRILRRNWFRSENRRSPPQQQIVDRHRLLRHTHCRRVDPTGVQPYLQLLTLGKGRHRKVDPVEQNLPDSDPPRHRRRILNHRILHRSANRQSNPHPTQIDPIQIDFFIGQPDPILRKVHFARFDPQLHPRHRIGISKQYLFRIEAPHNNLAPQQR